MGRTRQVPAPTQLLFEPFLDSADVSVQHDNDGGGGGGGGGGERLQWRGDSRWLEVTVGVLGPRGALKAMSPSVTLREHGAVLSLEEKFQVRLFCVTDECGSAAWGWYTVRVCVLVRLGRGCDPGSKRWLILRNMAQFRFIRVRM